MQEDEVLEALRTTGRGVRQADSSVVLYHAASSQAARYVLDSGTLATRDSKDGVFVSSSPAILSLCGDWEVVVIVRVLVADLEISADERENDDAEIRRVDLRLRTDEHGVYRPIAVGRAAYDGPGARDAMPPGWDI